MKRIFEFRGDGSNKFWEIVRDGNSVTTRWGKIGVQGQSKTKEFDSDPEAEKEYSKLVKEKTGKGYVEQSAPPIATNAKTVLPENESIKATAGPELAAQTAVHSADCVDVPEEVEIDFTSQQSLELDPNIQRLFQEMLEGHFEDDETIVDAIAAQLPEELRDIAKDVVTHQPHGALPERLTLENAERGSIHPNAIAQQWLSELKARKAKHLGDFVIVEFPVAMQVYCDTCNRIVVISYMGDQTWVDIVLHDKEGNAWTWTNAATSDGKTPPWSYTTHRPDADLERLFELADESKVESGEEPYNAKKFVKSFTEAVSQSMIWRNSIAESETIRAAPPSEIERRVYQFARAYARDGYHARKPVKSIPTAESLLNASPVEAIEALISAFRMERCVIEEFRHDVLEELCEALFKRNLPFSSADIDCLATFIYRSIRLDDADSLTPPFIERR